jgi:fructokinase
MGKAHYKLGIDLGGTKTEAIVLDQNDKALLRRRIATPRNNGNDEYQMILSSLCDLILESIKAVPRGIGFTIGIGTPGSVDPSTGLIQNSNTNCLNRMPLKQDIEERIGRQVGMQNDANCFTLAESIQGAGKDFQVVFGIIMGTGCGGGISINGKIVEGANGIAGEWGHVSIDSEGAECYCGNRGCIETKISGSGVENAFFSRFAYRLKMEQIVAGFRKGDGSCTVIFRQFLEDFGRAAGGLISVLDPEAVVIGGGLSNIDELYGAGVELIRKYAFHPKIHTPILKNKLGDSAGVIGAAWIGC